MVDFYGRTLAVALRFRFITLLVLLATIGLNVYLFLRVPKGFFPQQDNGRIQGSIQADQDTSFQAMDKILLPMINIVAADPAVDTVNGFTPARANQRAAVHFAEAAGGAQDHGRSGSSRGCGRSWRGFREPRCSCRRRRICAWAGGRATRNINSRCTATIWTI